MAFKALPCLLLWSYLFCTPISYPTLLTYQSLCSSTDSLGCFIPPYLCSGCWLSQKYPPPPPAPSACQKSTLILWITSPWWEAFPRIPLSKENWQLPHFLTKSKLVLLPTWQVNKLRDSLLGQGVGTLSEKPAGREDGGLVSQRTIFPELNSGFVNTKRRGGKVLVPGCLNFFFSVAIYRWAWSGGFLWAEQGYFSLTLIIWEAGFSEMSHYVYLKL